MWSCGALLGLNDLLLTCRKWSQRLESPRSLVHSLHKHDRTTRYETAVLKDFRHGQHFLPFVKMQSFIVLRISAALGCYRIHFTRSARILIELRPLADLSDWAGNLASRFCRSSNVNIYLCGTFMSQSLALDLCVAVACGGKKKTTAFTVTICSSPDLLPIGYALFKPGVFSASKNGPIIDFSQVHFLFCCLL